MKEYPAFKLTAVTHKDIAYASKVFSLQEFQPYLYVDIPVYIAKHFSLYELDEIVEKAEPVCVKCLWDHPQCSIWYRFHTNKLNQESGYHCYRMCFVDTFTKDIVYLYFAYTVQTNNPDKPYIYMDLENRKCNCAESNS